MATTQPTSDRTADNIQATPDHPPAEPAPSSPPPWRNRRLLRRFAVGLTVAVVAVVVAVAGMSGFSAGPQKADDQFVYHTVRRNDLPITITERGTLESQDNIEIICEVDDAPGDGISGTPILWIVENGSLVEKGDLLVELDASQHLERLDQQILDTDRALASKTQANIQFESRDEKNKTREMKAELDVQLAQLALEQYEDENGGTFQIQLQDIDLGIQQQRARWKILDKNYEAVKKLATMGYKSSGDLAQAQLSALEAKNNHESAQSQRKKLVDYSYEKQRLQLEGDLASTERALIQIRRDNSAKTAQARVAKDTADRAYAKEQERLADYREQLEKCKIYAPQSGLVAYAMESGRRGQSTSIEEGAAVRNQQHILSIPDLNRMQVEMAVHESVVDLTRAGLPATIRIDAFPDQSYRGSVKSVAVLPDPGGWLSSGAKVYNTVVAIDGQVDKLKPGMTAVVEIDVEVLHSVLSVPIQAIVQRGKETWCYVSDGGKIKRRSVKLGKSNDNFVEVASGLEVGETVILNPSAVLETESTNTQEISPEASRSSEIAF